MFTSLKNVPVNVKVTVFTFSLLLFLFMNFTSVSHVFIILIDYIYRFTGVYLMIEIDTLFYLILASVPVFGMFYSSTKPFYNRNEFVLDVTTLCCCVFVVFAAGLILQGITGHNSNPLIPQSLKAGLFPFYSHLTLIIGIALPFLLVPNKSKFKSD
jgi:uncharacterized membrane protein